MQVGWWIGAIFDVMMVAGVVSAAIAMAMLIDTVLLPIDWALALLYPETMPAFVASSMANAAQVMRLRLGQFTVVAAGLGTPAMIWINDTFNRDLHGPAWNDIYFGSLTLVVIWLIGASYAYEFYAIRPEAERKVLSSDYARLFLYNLALPVLFWFLFATGQQSGFVGYADKHVFGTGPKALLVAMGDPTPCDALLERAGLRVRYTDAARGGGVADPMPWIDEYLRGVTFGVPDLFGCSFVDIQLNPDDPAVRTAVLLFRLMVSFFSVSVLLLPAQRLFRLARRAAAKSAG